MLVVLGPRSAYLNDQPSEKCPRSGPVIYCKKTYGYKSELCRTELEEEKHLSDELYTYLLDKDGIFFW